jgi:CHAT domain-containing protein
MRLRQKFIFKTFRSRKSIRTANYEERGLSALETIAEALIAIQDTAADQFLSETLAGLDRAQIDELIRWLQERVIQDLRSDGRAALRTADRVLRIGRTTGVASDRALGHRLVAQAQLIGTGDLQAAKVHYERALELYAQLNDSVGRADTLVTYVWLLALDGEYAEAVEQGTQAIAILELACSQRAQATLQNNLAMIHFRFGKPSLSLRLLERSRASYEALGTDGAAFLTNNAINRASALCDLGRYEESILVSERARRLAAEHEQPLLETRAQHNLALTYLFIGHPNQALQRLNAAREGWLRDGRFHDLAQCELVAAICLIQLRRYEAVLSNCRSARDILEAQGIRHEVAQTHQFEAQALAALNRFDEGLESLELARMLFQAEDNAYWVQRVALVTARFLGRQGRWNESEDVSLACAKQFADRAYLKEEAAAYLVAAKAALELKNYTAAGNHIAQAAALTENRNLGQLDVQANFLAGQAATQQDQLKTGYRYFEQALEALEQIQHRIMTEQRADYLMDSEATELFEQMIVYQLQHSDLRSALSLIGRAKSRAMLDVIEERIDLTVRASAPADEADVETLNALIRRRNILYRQQARSDPAQLQGADETHPEEITDLETRIEALRQQVLINQYPSAGTGRTQVSKTIDWDGLKLEETTGIIEYFFIDQQPIAFVIRSRRGEIHIEAVRLSIELRDITHYRRLLSANFNAAAQGQARHLPQLEQMANGILRHLHQELLAPLAPHLEDTRHLIFIPHQQLHYLPFQALYDGEAYLIESHEVSYLPSLHFLSLQSVRETASLQALIIGHSYDGMLPQAVAEAESVHRRLSGTLLLEEQASLAAVSRALGECAIFHCAAHGEFRADSPLFSGVALSDGWLTALAIYDLELRASLVTLSACESGVSRIGGGDELLGLMRAFLIAGAEAILMSQWAVEDASTASLMTQFYKYLFEGSSKAEALQRAQQAFISGQTGATRGYQHPVFWAAFQLVGSVRALQPGGNLPASAYSI